jgi:hypothetical protein
MGPVLADRPLRHGARDKGGLSSPVRRLEFALPVSGGGLTVVVTFQPYEAIPDLIALDGEFVAQVVADLTTNGFWNFDPHGCHYGGLGIANVRPPNCASPEYADTWSLPGSVTNIVCVQTGPSTEAMPFSVDRPGGLAVTTDEKVFGATITVDGAAATEVGGSCGGCSAPFFLVCQAVFPRSAGAAIPSQLDFPTGAHPGVTNMIGVNGGMSLCCAVPARKHTWGQLKSLYR